MNDDRTRSDHPRAGRAMIRLATALLFGLFLAPPAGAQSLLKTTAAAMAPDTWAVLNTNNINIAPTSTNPLPTLLAGGASGIAFGDGTNMVWDPVGQRVHFIGMDHEAGAFTRHVVYDAATNTWLRMPDPPFPQNVAGEFVNHEFGMTAIDARGRKIYRRNQGGLTIHRYDIATGQWTSPLSTPPISVAEYTVGLGALAFHYERGTAGRVVFSKQESGSNGVLYEYDPVTTAWSRVVPGLLAGYPDCLSTAAYSEVLKITFFSGGCYPTGWQMNSQGAVTQTAPYPNCTPSDNRNGLIHADTLSGNFVMLCGSGSASWHIYNPITNTWVTKPDPASVPNHVLNLPSPAGTWPTWLKIGVPIIDYGVIMYVACLPLNCQVRLYKGGPVTATPAPTRPTGVQLK